MEKTNLPQYMQEYSPRASMHYVGEQEVERPTPFSRLIDSFRRDPNAQATRVGALPADGRVYDHDVAAYNTANSGLQRGLKGRHLQMIAIGGSIGTGLFVGSGSALATGGPASLFVSFCIIGIMLYCTVHALGEMAVAFPVAGGFSAYSTRFLDVSWGFAMGWNYAMQWLVVMPLEIVSATLVIDFWTNYGINNDAWVAIFFVLITAINLFGVRGYGEAEFIFSVIKVIAVIGWILLAIILNCGGDGSDIGYIGGRYWNPPYEPFLNGFKGLCSVLVNAAFAYAGTELVGLAAAETVNPRKSLPTAIRQVFWRIFGFYIISLLLVGLLVPSDDSRLLGSSSADTTASPFVIAIYNAGIDGLPSVMNAVILIAVVSVGNSSVYGSSRTLAALANQGQAPRILGYVDRQGRPVAAILVSASLGLLAFFAGSSYQTELFDWLLALSGLSSIFTWGSICLAHLRFRKAWAVQGHALDELAFRSQPGIYGSWLGLILNCLVLLAQIWVAIWPLGWEELGPTEVASAFFQACLAIPVILLFYLSHKLWYRTGIMRTHNMNLSEGMREHNIAELKLAEKLEYEQWSRFKRVYRFMC